MWIIFLLPLFVFAKDVAGEIDCDKHFFDQCERPKLFEEIPREMEVFNALCPDLLSYTQCSRDFDMKCLEANERRFAQQEKYADLYDLYEEICEEGTALNEVVTIKLKCFNETFSNTNCPQERDDFLKPYRKEIQMDEFTTTHVIPERVHCLSQMLLVKCLVDDITTSCGLRAWFLTAEFLRRSEFVERSCPLTYRTGLLEDIDEFNLTEVQKRFAVSELLYMELSDDV